MWSNFLLRLVTRNADAIVDFIERLRDKLNEMIIAHAAEIGKLEAFVEETIEDGKQAIAEIEQNVENQVTAYRSQIAEVGAKIEQAKALANGLPGRG